MKEIPEYKKSNGTVSFSENDFIHVDSDEVPEFNPKTMYPIGCPYSLQDIMDGVMCETEDYIDK